jgi:hypothetical protein
MYSCMEKWDLLSYSRNGGERIKENDGGAEFNSITYYKNFCKCHNVPPVEKYDNNE